MLSPRRRPPARTAAGPRARPYSLHPLSMVLWRRGASAPCNHSHPQPPHLVIATVRTVAVRSIDLPSAAGRKHPRRICLGQRCPPTEKMSHPA